MQLYCATMASFSSARNSRIFPTRRGGRDARSGHCRRYFDRASRRRDGQGGCPLAAVLAGLALAARSHRQPLVSDGAALPANRDDDWDGVVERLRSRSLSMSRDVRRGRDDRCVCRGPRRRVRRPHRYRRATKSRWFAQAAAALRGCTSRLRSCPRARARRQSPRAERMRRPSRLARTPGSGGCLLRQGARRRATHPVVLHINKVRRRWR